MDKPPRTFWQIWNMSFGFLGIQFGWGLQMANMSAIYEYLGAGADQIPILWLAAPLTGSIVQPIIGHASDFHVKRLLPTRRSASLRNSSPVHIRPKSQEMQNSRDVPIADTSRATGLRSRSLPAVFETRLGRSRGSDTESRSSGGMPSPHPLPRREAWCKADSCRRMPRRYSLGRAFPARLPCHRRSRSAHHRR